MKIGIDARFVGPQGTGLGKYTEKLIENLTKIDKKNQYVIFLRRDNWDYLKIEGNFKKIIADVPWYSAKEQIRLPQIFKSQNLDLLHVPHFNAPIFYKGKFIVTIHDLIHHQFNETSATTKNFFTFKIKRFAYRKVISHAIYKSAKILTPSNFVKDEIIKAFKIDPSKITVTYEAAEEEYSLSTRLPERSEGSEKRQNFLLYVGNAYPHKNLNRLLEAFKILTTNYKLSITKLVLVCPRDIFWERLNKEISNRSLEKKVELTGYKSARELSSLFKVAKVYVFPSLSEGFGIPGLNAMASGIPLAASDIPTLKEVYKDAALYFDPNDEKNIAQKIQKILSDKKLSDGLIEKGKKLVKEYSWGKMAKETLKVYESA